MLKISLAHSWHEAVFNSVSHTHKGVEVENRTCWEDRVWGEGETRGTKTLRFIAQMQM